jgi:hypothetical protein
MMPEERAEYEKEQADAARREGRKSRMLTTQMSGYAKSPAAALAARGGRGRGRGRASMPARVRTP